MQRSSYALLFVLLTSPLVAQEWTPLFDGLTFNGWETPAGKPVDAPAWEVADGMLHLDRSKGRGGSLVTDRDYGDFELLFEWKVAPGANNGIKYRVKEFDDGRTLGVEYQVIDDFGKPNLTAKHKTASIYDIYDAKEHEWLRPAGEFNRGRIVVRNNRLEHWLNGHLIAAADVGSDEWNTNIANSKFAKVEGFGINRLGRIMITDHNDEVWYRNVFIREFEASDSPVVEVMASTEAFCCCPSVSPVATRGLFRRRWFRR